jgi:threonine/homoserine/homoserine lactone efflux protein
MGLTQSIIGIAFLWTLAIAQEMARPWLQGRYFPLVVEITAGIAFTGFAILTAASLL